MISGQGVLRTCWELSSCCPISTVTSGVQLEGCRFSHSLRQWYLDTTVRISTVMNTQSCKGKIRTTFIPVVNTNEDLQLISILFMMPMNPQLHKGKIRTTEETRRVQSLLIYNLPPSGHGPYHTALSHPRTAGASVLWTISTGLNEVWDSWIT
jgi:hypothetical protein